MTRYYEELRSSVLARATAEGLSPGVAAMQTMVLQVTEMSRDIPDPLAQYLVTAQHRWLSLRADLASLTQARVAAWEFLERKNGDSVTIADRVDVAIRALICVLWDDADEGGELEEGLEFFAQLVIRYRDLE